MPSTSTNRCYIVEGFLDGDMYYRDPKRTLIGATVTPDPNQPFSAVYRRGIKAYGGYIRVLDDPFGALAADSLVCILYALMSECGDANSFDSFDME